MDYKLAVVLLCRERNWTYQEYMAQPVWFIDILKTVERLDGEKAAKEQAEAEAQAKAAQRKSRR